MRQSYLVTQSLVTLESVQNFILQKPNLVGYLGASLEFKLAFAFTKTRLFQSKDVCFSKPHI